jgi:hypothetical protein
LGGAGGGVKAAASRRTPKVLGQAALVDGAILGDLESKPARFAEKQGATRHPEKV